MGCGVAVGVGVSPRAGCGVAVGAGVGIARWAVGGPTTTGFVLSGAGGTSVGTGVGAGSRVSHAAMSASTARDMAIFCR